MNTHTYFILAVLLFLFSCKRNQEQSRTVSFAPKVIETKGYVVPKDSVAEPKVVPAGKPRVVRAGNPKVVTTYTNVHPAGIPKFVIAGSPRVCTPGQDSFLLPKTVTIINAPWRASIPEVVIAKQAYSKDQNPQNFSSFGKLQGLKHNQIPRLLLDNIGNIWFVTNGAGVSKYDGKNFTHFTEKEGLIQNNVWSILQDKNGDLWFGTSGGLSRYDGRGFVHFTEKEGLSNNWVRDILEDKKGNLWFATGGGGVSRYDGKGFTNFTEKEGLSNNHIWSMAEDKHGHLWFGTDGGGVNRYDGNSFAHFTKKEGLSHNTVLSIVKDKNGDLWFGTNGGGVSKYNGIGFVHFTEKEGLSNNSVMDILEDKKGHLWFGTGGGASKYDGKNFTHFTEKEGLNSNGIGSILEDSKGNLWFGTWGGGVNKVDGKRFSHFTEKEGLSSNSVLGILEDKKGNLWFGTRGGVSKYNASGDAASMDTGKRFTHYTEIEGLSNNFVLSTLEDKSGNLWFGTKGAGVCKYDGKNFTRFAESEDICHNSIYCMLEDKKGNLWFGTFGEGVCKYDASGDAASDDAGKSFTYFTKKEGLSDDKIFSMLEDKKGNLWFGTFGGGVTKYDPSVHRSGGSGFTHFTEKEGLSNNYVRSILEDTSGNLWFSTEGGGVNKYDGKSFTHFTEKEGLSSNIVSSSIQDKSGNLWFGTSFGLNKLEKNKLASFDKKAEEKSIHSKTNLDKTPFNLIESEPFFKNYTNEDGFAGIGVKPDGSICETRDGNIWIPADDRLTVMYPEAEVMDTTGPNLQLTSLTLFNENIPWQNFMSTPGNDGHNSIPAIVGDRKVIEDTSTYAFVLSNGVKVHDFYFDSVSKWYGVPENLSLAHDNNYLTFQFVGIEIQSPKKVKYQYKLEGLDQNWSALTHRSEATYGNLPHGGYTFKVKALGSGGHWSKELAYSFFIRPPWWLTWRFRIFSMIIFVGSVTLILYLWFQHVLRQKLKVELIRQKIAADLHDEIVSNLSSMAFSAELVKKKLNGSRKDIDPILNNLKSNFQETSSLISDTIWSLNPKNDSFDKLQERMQNFTHDILSSKEIDYRFHANGHRPAPAFSLEQKRNIYLIYKEAINNIAKHSKATMVNIRLESLPDKLVIEIMDDGIGFDTSKTYDGNGLNNFKSRSVKDSCEVQYFSVAGKGTVVKIIASYYPLKSMQHLEPEKQKSTPARDKMKSPYTIE